MTDPAAGIAFPAFLFLAGAGLLVLSIERLIESLAKAAVVTGISAFLLAVVFVGLDFENWAFGIAAAFSDLPGIALGSAFGSALFLVGVALPAAGLVSPFRPRVPFDYLVLMGLSPLLLLPFLLDGWLTRAEGGVLLVALGLGLAYLYRAERRGRTVVRDEEADEAARQALQAGRGAWYYLGLCALLVVGVVVGARLAVRGAEGLVGTLGLDETAFGMTFVGLVMSLEEVLLVVEPVRKGRPSIAAGNVVGSLLFFCTGNVGLLTLPGRLPVDPAILGFYWPFLAGATWLVALLFARGRMGRPEALLLAASYVLFWYLSWTFAGPIG